MPQINSDSGAKSHFVPIFNGLQFPINICFSIKNNNGQEQGVDENSWLEILHTSMVLILSRQFCF